MNPLNTHSGTANTANSGINLHSTGTSAMFNQWSHPERVEVNEYSDYIEMIYKQASLITYASHPSPPPEERVFKIVFSCVDGKWNKSEPIYGKTIPAQDEYYEFEE